MRIDALWRDKRRTEDRAINLLYPTPNSRAVFVLNYPVGFDRLLRLDSIRLSMSSWKSLRLPMSRERSRCDTSEFTSSVSGRPFRIQCHPSDAKVECLSFTKHRIQNMHRSPRVGVLHINIRSSFRNSYTDSGRPYTLEQKAFSLVPDVSWKLIVAKLILPHWNSRNCVINFLVFGHFVSGIRSCNSA